MVGVLLGEVVIPGGNKPSSCSGLQVGLVQVTGMRPPFVPWIPVPGSSCVLAAAPAQWQEEFQALQCSPCSTCSCCGQDGSFKEVLIHQLEGTASRISSGDISVGKSLKALILILYFQASGLRNAVKSKDSSWKTCPIFLPSAAGAHSLCTQHLEELWRTPPFFVPSAARSCFKWVILWWLSVLYMTHLVFLQLWQSGKH